MKRYLDAQVRADLRKKMVFIAGPRQVGKTTLARRMLGRRPGYLTWDAPEDRDRILTRALPESTLWVFDELHKYRSWRNYLKGLYDKKTSGQQILVTGSARLDYYRRGGDSLQGRYHFLHLYPLTLAELGGSQADLVTLLRLGGFPEPFLSGSEATAKRWSREHRSLIIREEITSLEQIVDLGNLELLALRLPELVGAPLSVNALREDLQLAHKTVASWLDALERLYAIFRIAPFGAPAIRAVKKMQKHYHFDWSVVPSDSARFENLVALHLLKWIHFEQDTKGRDLDLRYFRDRDDREVDFIIVDGRRPIQCIECKWNDAELSPHLRYFKQRFPECAAWQISAVGTQDYQKPDGTRVCPAWKYLNQLV